MLGCYSLRLQLRRDSPRCLYTYMYIHIHMYTHRHTNFDPEAVQSGICEYFTQGCMDITAYNYNSAATVRGACMYIDVHVCVY